MGSILRAVSLLNLALLVVACGKDGFVRPSLPIGTVLTLLPRAKAEKPQKKHLVLEIAASAGNEVPLEPGTIRIFGGGGELLFAAETSALREQFESAPCNAAVRDFVRSSISLVVFCGGALDAADIAALDFQRASDGKVFRATRANFTASSLGVEIYGADLLP